MRGGSTENWDWWEAHPTIESRSPLVTLAASRAGGPGLGRAGSLGLGRVGGPALGRAGGGVPNLTETGDADAAGNSLPKSFLVRARPC